MTTLNQNNQNKAYEFHSLADVFPMMEEADLRQLAYDIEKNGQKETIKVWQGKIVDGRNRYKACLLRDVDPKFEELTFEPTLEYVCGLNIQRRHLNETQRAWIAAKLAKVHICTQAGGAKMMNVSVRSVLNASSIMKDAIPEISEEVAKGRISASTGEKISKLDADTQKSISRLKPKQMLKAARLAKQTKEDPAPRTHIIKFTVTEEEFRLINNAVKRIGTPDTQEELIREALLGYCHNAYPASIKDLKRPFQMKRSYSNKDHMPGKNGYSKYELDAERYEEHYGRQPD